MNSRKVRKPTEKMPKFTQPKFHMCRLCLCATPVHFSLIENSDLRSKLESLTSLQIDPNDQISTVICTKCLLNLNMAYKIQQYMVNAEKRFHDKQIHEKSNHETQIHEKLIKQEEVMLSDSEETMDETETAEIGENRERSQSELRERMVATSVTRRVKAALKNSTTVSVDREKSSSELREKIVATSVAQRVKAELKSIAGVALTCDMCGKECASRQSLTMHRNNHRKEMCKVCGKVVSKCNMRVHLDMHNAVPCVCELCGATLKSVHNLRQHMFYSHHESRFQCAFCDKKFKKKTQCRVHENKEHKETPDLVCDQCGKKFYSARTLKAHVDMKHLGLRPYECDFCKKKFCSSHAMKTHRRQHTNETPYKCQHCGLGFRQNVSLKSHLKSKHGVVEVKTVQCPVCEKAFASKVALYTHQRLH